MNRIILFEPLKNIIYEELIMNKNAVPVPECKKITEVVARYVEAIRNGDVDMLADLFHQGAVTYGTVDGRLVGGIGNPAIDFIKKHGASPELNSHVDILGMTPTIAVVRVVTEKDAVGSECAEFLTLLKLDGTWTIIAKAFHQFDQ